MIVMKWVSISLISGGWLRFRLPSDLPLGYGWNDQHCHEVDGQPGDDDDNDDDDDDDEDHVVIVVDAAASDDDDFAMQGTNLADLAMKAASAAATNHSS